MSFDKYHKEIADNWQICVDNTSFDDVDGCDFVESAPEEDLDSIINSFRGKVITEECYKEFLEMEHILSVIEENWPDVVEHAEDLIKIEDQMRKTRTENANYKTTL